MWSEESLPLFSLHNVTVFRQQSGIKRLVLSQVSLTLEPLELVDIAGASGAGKSTLLEAAARLIPIAEGNMTLEGRRYTAFSPPEWRRKVALYLQTPVAAPGSVRENLLLPWRFTRKPDHDMPSVLRLESELEEIGLSEVSLDVRASELSGGQLARLALVRLVLLQPRVLLLDEPEASLDRDSARLVNRRIRRYLNENQAAAIRIRHFAWDEPASRTLTVREGTVFEEV
ncbi:MAG: ATP-binding cassette domain-containing protein [bacterium]